MTTCGIVGVSGGRTALRIAGGTTWPPAAVPLGLAVLATVPAVPGKLLLLDVACLAALPLLLGTLLDDRRLGGLTLVGAGLACGLTLADIGAGSGPRASANLAMVVTVVAVTAALARLADGDPDRLRPLIAAVAAGLAANQLAFPARSLDAGTHVAAQWKYALGIPVSVAVLALCDLAWRAGSRPPTFLALAALAAVDLAADFRSLAVMTLFTLALYASAGRRGGRLHGAATVLLVGALCVLSASAFLYAARAGWLGQRSADQFDRDPVDVYPMVVNARPELLQSLYLASQRPLTGYGSVPRLDGATFDASLDFLTGHGVVVDGNLRKDWLAKTDPGVAGHSMVLDTTVQAGVLALPFWVFLWSVAIRRSVAAIRLRASPLSVFWTLLVLWDTLFSPLTGLYHVLLAAYLALVLLPLPAPPDAARGSR